MRKGLLYYFLFATIFVTSFRVFSLETSHNQCLKTFRNISYFNTKFAKATVFLGKAELLTDFDGDEEDHLKAQQILCLTNCFILEKSSTSLVFYKFKRSQSSTYSLINLSRIPRFSFLSLNVLRI